MTSDTHNDSGQQLSRWLTGNKTGRIFRKAGILLGRLMHKLLFGLFLPKRFRGLTRKDIYRIIFKSDTPEGRKFDIWLLVLIDLNLLLLILDSVPVLHDHLGLLFRILEWCFTIIFTFEYYLRIYCLRRPWRYVLSFYGLIDFFSIFPVYLSLFVSATQTLSVLRLLRLLRLFRILKLQRFIDEGSRLMNSLRRSMYKILIFMLFVFITAIILGAVVYTIENGKNPNITSIPLGIYWAVVTLTTVGYGDITPVTPTGQFISLVVMILGYSIIAVPTGIVTGEVIAENHERRSKEEERKAQPSRPNGSNAPVSDSADAEGPAATTAATPELVAHCPHCGHDEQDPDALYCKHCGTRLDRVNSHSWISEFFSK